MLLAVVAAFAVLVAFWVYSRKRKQTLLQRHGFKGPKPHFIFGHSHELFSKNNIEFVSKCFQEYGPIVALYSGCEPMLYTIDEDLLKMVQIKDFHLFMDRMRLVRGNRYPGKVSESHIISTNGKRWREMRGILTPTFSANKLKQMNPEISDAIEMLTSKIGKVSDKGEKEFNIYPLFQGLTMDVIGRAAFGIRTDAQLKDTHPFIENSKKVFSGGRSIILGFAMWFPEFSFITYPLRLVTATIYDVVLGSAHAYLYSACRQILQERRKGGTRKDLLQAMIDAKMNRDDVSSTRGAALTVSSDMSAPDGPTPLQENGASTQTSKKYTIMNDDEIVGNAFVFLEAGYETTSTTLAYLSHILVNHQDVQDRVRDEINQLLEKEGKIDYNSMTSLPYMEAVIYETLRMYPPVTYFVNRRAAEDYSYKGQIIPKGTSVTAAVPQIHRNPEFWEDPDKFDPERFNKENKSRINPVHWQSFGTGPRNCVGMRFALLEIKLAIAEILPSTALSPDQTPRLEI